MDDSGKTRPLPGDNFHNVPRVPLIPDRPTTADRMEENMGELTFGRVFGVDQGAVFSPDRRHRYDLWRIWDPARPPVNFVCLNPSTADEHINDPTVTRCIGFARSWGYGGMHMLNIFALRSTDPKVLAGNNWQDSIGRDNDQHLREIKGDIVAAWGNWGGMLDRGLQVRGFWETAQCFGLTKVGEPMHPLYLPRDIARVPLERNYRQRWIEK